MNRSAPLARRTPLKRTGRLIPRQFKRRIVSFTGPSPEVRALVIARDGGRCVCCGESGREIHHRLPRGMSGSSDPAINSPSNLLVLCMLCHRSIESWRDHAVRYGYIVRRGVVRPAAAKVLLWGVGWALLHEDGTRELVAA